MNMLFTVFHLSLGLHLHCLLLLVIMKLCKQCIGNKHTYTKANYPNVVKECPVEYRLKGYGRMQDLKAILIRLKNQMPFSALY